MPARPRFCAAAAAALLAAACSTAATEEELSARADLAAAGDRLRPDGARPVLPVLSAESPLADFLRHALLSNPRVEGAYHAWAASVERIVGARTPEDPRLGFTVDLADALMSLMPGLMAEFPARGALDAAGAAASAESRALRFAFEREILAAALELKTVYYRLRLLEDSLRIEHEALRLLEDVENVARQSNAVGSGGLQDVLRARIELDLLAARIANLEDSRHALAAAWKAALGLGLADPDPPQPAAFEESHGAAAPDALLAAALERNPDLRALDAEVARAQALLALARRGATPRFEVGIEADWTPDPNMLRLSTAATLPVWRERIAADIAAAQSDQRAADARLSAAQIRIVADLAAGLYDVREASRDEALLRDRLLPLARETLQLLRAGYASGRAGFLDLLDAQRRLLEFELAAAQAAARREEALAFLALALAGAQPAEGPAHEIQE